MAFSSAISALPVGPDPLPLTHLTDYQRSLAILQSGEISAPTPCPVFNENLVYAFYGRPAYRVNFSNTDAYTSVSYAPICFIFKPETASAKRVFPFDSGGFSLYRASLHHIDKVDDFLLSDQSCAQRLVGMFYGTNLSYYDIRPLSWLTFGALEVDVQNYYNLITGAAHGGDDRNSAIEFQFDAPLSLSGNLLAVIIPHQLAQDAAVAGILSKLNALPIPYKLPGRYRPVEFLMQFRGLVEDFYRRSGYL
ncbi:hypothetical protein [Magnetospirillum sp. 15-1]|uniref:hypothetical protein n=1 Tax=Magnetospirillum sp. 15-1 TaxID=1979370 RepID=UPI001141BAF4|nr:hypothetical protein [Magnetospirillum sp. 15-1]